MLCGGFAQHEVTEAHGELVNRHLNDINTHLTKTFASVSVKKYQKQIVAGTNHLFELEANDGTKLSAKIFEPLPHTGAPTQLSNAQLL